MVRPVMQEAEPRAPVVNGLKENGNGISETESGDEGMDTVSLYCLWHKFWLTSLVHTEFN